MDYEKIDSNILLLGRRVLENRLLQSGDGKYRRISRDRSVFDSLAGHRFKRKDFFMQAKLKNFANRWIGTITADSVAAAVQCAREQARKAGLRG